MNDKVKLEKAYKKIEELVFLLKSEIRKKRMLEKRLNININQKRIPIEDRDPYDLM